jgi:bacteriorhodopsin
MCVLKQMKVYPQFTPLGASFYVTFLALAGTTLLTFASSISPSLKATTTNEQLQNVLLLENGVNLIASYMYTYFIQDAKDGILTTSEMINIRYLDWLLTTPLLLLSLVYYLDYINRNKAIDPAEKLQWPQIGAALLCNVLMLLAGFLGETKRIPKSAGLVAGFVAFFGIFKILYDSYVANDDNEQSKKLFAYFVVTWSLYGVFYMVPNPTIKNFGYNILDLLAKVGFGLYTVATAIDNSRGVA